MTRCTTLSKTALRSGKDIAGGNGSNGFNQAELFKYLHQPRGQMNPGDIGAHYVFAKQANVAVKESQEDHRPPFRTIAVQTVYREQESQTIPCSLTYKLKDTTGQPPEVLALATLTFGTGLPAGLAEVEMIERARAKRAWEATLPDGDDKASFERRVRMMEQMELQEWQEREQEIQRLQDARMEVLRQIIADREAQMDEANAERLQKLWQRKLQEKEFLTEKLRSKKLKMARKLAEKRRQIDTTLSRKRDIIQDYTNSASEIYLPKKRNGNLTTSFGTNLPDMDPFLQNLENIEQIQESHVLPSVDKDFSLANFEKDGSSSQVSRRERQMQRQLHLLQQKFFDKYNKSSSKNEDTAERPLKCVVRIKKTVERPPTPYLVAEEQTAANELVIPGSLENGNAFNVTKEELERAAILLQKVIRGRAMQALMYQGKERRKSLIKELQTRHRLAQAAHTAIADAVLSPDRSLLGPGVHVKLQEMGKEDTGHHAHGFGLECDVQSIHSASQIPSVLDSSSILAERKYESLIQAEFVGQQLDFYTKEIVRLREQRRIAAMVKLAERTRRMREAAESGMRQAEINHRKHQDAVFKQVMGVHHETVDIYLESIVLSAVETTSSIVSREQVREFASRINAFLDDLKEREHAGEDVNVNLVNDLVTRFLIPEVKRELLRDQIRQQQEKYPTAADSALQDSKAEIESLLSTQIKQLNL